MLDGSGEGTEDENPVTEIERAESQMENGEATQMSNTEKLLLPHDWRNQGHVPGNQNKNESNMAREETAISGGTALRGEKLG